MPGWFAVISPVLPGINDSGQVGGASSTSAGEFKAFITGPDGVGMIDLPDGVILTEVRDINNEGQVIAIAITSSIPEPEGYAMLLAGLSLVGFMVRRKKMDARAFTGYPGHCNE